MFSKNCEVCGKITHRKKKSEATRKNWRFCSRHCQTIFQNKSRRLIATNKVCLNCNKLFEVRTGREKKYIFCSHRCALGFRNRSEDNIRKVREKISGPNNYNWKGGKSIDFHKSLEWRDWRRAIFERDDYTCQECGKRGGKFMLQPHHKKPVALYPEYIYDIDNGITLCVPCHKKTDTWGFKMMWLLRRRK